MIIDFSGKFDDFGHRECYKMPEKCPSTTELRKLRGREGWQSKLVQDLSPRLLFFPCWEDEAHTLQAFLWEKVTPLSEDAQPAQLASAHGNRFLLKEAEETVEPSVR